MGLFTPILDGLFAGKVAGRLLDLGVDVLRLDASLKEILYEVERTKRKELTPHEAAAYFFCAAFSNIPRECYLLPISQNDMAYRSLVIMEQWVEKRKMRHRCFQSYKESLATQL